ncbi:MAG: cell division protein FtsZ [Burkholderiaceae bacterium]|nr:cell division protein FtsZ [Burkholderiaceae bacterium]
MSTLQISLAIIGGLILALIVAYNAWSSRRNAPKRALPPELDAEPAADTAVRLDPAFETVASAPAAEGAPPPEPDAVPTMHRVDVQDALDLPVPPPVLERRSGLDPLIDVIATLLTESPVSGEAALAALPPTRRVGSKPFAIEGLNQATQHWEMPAVGQHYQSFHAGVQMANRMGALSEIEFSEFVHKVQAFADAINAAPDFPDMRHEVARARELDQFAGDHDAQLSFMLRARQAAWSPGYLQQNAARLGFVPGAMPGRLVLPSSTPGQPPLLTMGFDTQAALADDLDQSALRDLTLSLDVPHVPRTEQPLVRLRDAAASLCEAMDGVLCDQNGQPLPISAMDPIFADLELLYDHLDSRDLSAGSVLARRLFS